MKLNYFVEERGPSTRENWIVAARFQLLHNARKMMNRAMAENGETHDYKITVPAGGFISFYPREKKSKPNA